MTMATPHRHYEETAARIIADVHGCSGWEPDLGKADSVAQEAGIARARRLCVVIDNDGENLHITVTVNALNPALKVITPAASIAMPRQCELPAPMGW
jgi:voltage-gated potassium channel Kch